MNNNTFNYTDLAFDNNIDYEVSTMFNDDLDEYYNDSNLNFFGVCSNLSYSNLDTNYYEN